MFMMKTAKELQAKMEEIQEKISTLTAEGKAGGGLVAVTVKGKGEISGIHIDPSLLKAEEKEILEDLLIAAYNEARAKLDTQVEDLCQSFTAGLPLPAGFKLPF